MTLVDYYHLADPKPVNYPEHCQGAYPDRFMKEKSIYTLSVMIVLASGCSSIEPVAPYDRGYLAEEGMGWEADVRDAKLKGHVYTSKEASSGGAGAAGGGCGCN